MIKNDLRDLIAENNPDAVVLDNPSFDNSIIGMTTDGAVIYDLRKMVEELLSESDDDFDYEDALEFIEYNTLRAIPYSHSVGTPPIIMDDDAVRMEVEEDGRV